MIQYVCEGIIHFIMNDLQRSPDNKTNLHCPNDINVLVVYYLYVELWRELTASLLRSIRCDPPCERRDLAPYCNGHVRYRGIRVN